MPLQSSESYGIVEHYKDITTVAKAPACNHLHFYNTTLYFKATLTFWTRLVNQHGVLTVCVRNLGPQELGAPAAAIPHMKGNHLATRGIHGDPNPLLVRFLLHEAAHFIRFYLQAPQHDVAVTERTGDAMAASFFGRLLRA